MKISIYENKIQKQKIRLQYLQMQIRPHFLINALTSIYTMIDMKQLIGAKEMCRYLSRYFRFLSNESTDLIVISEELEHVENYLDIQRMRRPNQIFYECEVQEECRYCLVPPLLLLTFVENSIKYGIDMKRKQNMISVRVFKKENAVQIRISDNGPGFPDEVLTDIRLERPILRENRTCIGVSNVLSRLRLFFGEAAEISVYNEDGAVVEIKIPK